MFKQDPGCGRRMNYLLIPTLLVALVFFGVGVRLARKTGGGPKYNPLVIAGVLMALPGIVFSAYYLRLFGEAVWLYEFRSLPLTELVAGGAGFLAGLLHGRFSSEPRFRRIAGKRLLPGVLILGLLMPYAKPILRPPAWKNFQARWSEGVCLQSSESSCGPACAATLLKQFGKAATEKELAAECFTSRSGTENWYLARALRHRGIRVRFWMQESAEEGLPFPSIAGVRLSNFGNSGHFIAVLGQADDKYIIADPLEGKLLLSKAALQANYTFTGFFMRLD
jgi:hypothetical protein